MGSALECVIGIEDSMYLVDRDCRYLFMNERHLERFERC